MTDRSSRDAPRLQGKRSAAPAKKPAATASDAGKAAAGEKLQKVLARTGLGSRREMERWIEAGRIVVNGKVATLGDRVEARDRLAVDGRDIDMAPAQEARCILYHKPPGEVCSRNDPEGRRTVFARLPDLATGRWVSIGRLDYNTSGLLLFTTDGELANALMHPSSNIEREYMVRVMGDVDDEMIKRMSEGVMLEDGMARFTDIQQIGKGGINRWFCVVLMEGRNREVRRLWESQGLTVSRLKRVRYGEVFIPSKVKQGQWTEMERTDVKTLYRMAGIAPKEQARSTSKEREVMERQFGKRQRRAGAARAPARGKRPARSPTGRSSAGRSPSKPTKPS
jgi:23S rRNA pseudouridine2605 synthase